MPLPIGSALSTHPTRRPLAVALLLACAHAHGAPAPAPDAPADAAAELDRVEVVGHREGYAPTTTRSATRTDTLLRDVPQAVTVVDRDVMRDTAMTSMVDALRFVPGVGVAQGEGHRDAPIFRGNASTSDMYVDGMRDDVQYIRDTYNVERVEVLKGPSAMAFGRGGVGGVINRVTRVADGAHHREASLQLGEHARHRGTLDLGAPLGANAGVRVTALLEDSGSFRDGFELRREGINPTATFAFGEHTFATVGYEHFRDERVADRGVPSQLAIGIGKPVDVDPSTFFGTPDGSPIVASVDAATAFVEHDVNDAVVLRNRTRVADYDRFYQNVYPNGITSDGRQAIIAAYNNSMKRANAFNQTDLVATMTTGRWRHTLLAGAELGRQETDSVRLSGVFPAAPCGGSAPTTSVACVPLASPRYTGPVRFEALAGDANTTSVADIAALYVQDQVEFSPKWQAVLGVRYDRFEVEATNNRNGARFSSRDGLWSPRLGLVFKPVAPLSLYASWSNAWLPRAGEQLGSLGAANASLEPEEFRNLEVGAKWDVLPTLALTAAAYRLERNNVFTVDPADPTRGFLIDGQRSDGIELGIAGEITPRWKVIGSYAYQDAALTADIRTSPTAVLPAGTRLAQVPRHSASLWNRYDFSPRWGIGVGAVYRDAMFASTSNRVVLDGYARVDAAVYCALTDAVRLQANVENLLDTAYFANAHIDNNLMPGAPRSAHLTLNVKF